MYEKNGASCYRSSVVLLEETKLVFLLFLLVRDLYDLTSLYSNRMQGMHGTSRSFRRNAGRR
jgi:hypothetical protein